MLLVCVLCSEFLVGSSPYMLTNVLKAKSICSSCDLGSTFLTNVLYFFLFLHNAVSLVSAKRVLEMYLSDVARPSREISFQKAQERL